MRPRRGGRRPGKGDFPMSPHRRTAVVLAVLCLAAAAQSAIASPRPATPKLSPGAPSAAKPLARADVRQAEQWLADLGYWTGPVDGVWDDVSRHALVAF